jgi:uncharacterized protein DUF5818
MRKIVLTVATVVLLYAIAVGAAPVASDPSAVSGQDTPAARDKQPEIRVFLGTITKAGNQFIFSDAVSKSSYELDDQQTASRFDGQKVKVTGTLDASNNIIRVQSIETTA